MGSKKERALQAVRDIHRDPSLTIEDAIDALKEVREEIGILIEALNWDLKNQAMEND